MEATFFSILVAFFLWFFPYQQDLSILLILFPATLLATLPLVYATAWFSLQKGEQNITPRLIEMFAKDKRLRFTKLAVFLFPLLSLLIYLALPHFDQKLLMMAWVIAFGFVLDLSRLFLRRVTRYLNPFNATTIFTKEARENIRLGNLDELIDTIDVLSEISIRAIDRSNTSLAIQAIVELREIGDFFFRSARTFTNLTEELKSIEQKHVDKVSYTLFYLIGRLEMAAQKAVQRQFEPVLSHILSSMGRITISAAKFDLTLATFPILAIGKVARLAQEKGLKESGVKGQIILLEVAKAIIKEGDLTYSELKSPFFTIIDNLDKIAKDLFKEDKNVSIASLTQAFLQLKEILNDPKVETHQDTPLIQAEIERVLAEYSALQAVLLTMPPLPKASEV